jgi:hypothetical protein
MTSCICEVTTEQPLPCADLLRVNSLRQRGLRQHRLGFSWSHHGARHSAICFVCWCWLQQGCSSRPLAWMGDAWVACIGGVLAHADCRYRSPDLIPALRNQFLLVPGCAGLRGLRHFGVCLRVAHHFWCVACCPSMLPAQARHLTVGATDVAVLSVESFRRLVRWFRTTSLPNDKDKHIELVEV